MKHKHVGDPMKLCTGCIPEAQQIQAELRSRRFWGWAVVFFAFMLAGVSAFVLFKVGPMGR